MIDVKKLTRVIVCTVVYIASIIMVNTVLSTISTYIKYVIFGTIYIAIAYDVLWRAIRNIAKGRLFDENFLMTIATIGAFVIAEYVEGVAVMVFFQVGELFQDYAVNKSRRSIANLMDIQAETATVIVDSVPTVVHPSEVTEGQIIIVKVGEKIPLDGKVVSGNSFVDTSALTGESQPSFVEVGGNVLSGSINTSGVLHVMTTSTYDNSTVAKILQLVENASDNKAPSEQFISKFSRYYTPVVVILAVCIAIIPALFDGMWSVWTKQAMMFLLVSCPCALVISVPMSFFGGIGANSKKGILVKGSNYIENLSKANIFVFDKTGTLTQGKFAVNNIFPKDQQQYILQLAAIAESNSTHPIAMSILAECGEIDSSGYNFVEIAGKGIVADNGTQTIICGNDKLMTQYDIQYLPSTDYGTIIYVACNNKYIGYIAISDTIKQETKQAIGYLNSIGCSTIMLTGDNYSTAERIADSIGISQFESNLLPNEKVIKLENIIANSKPKDVTAFVGDGINDAPALMRADIGIAMGAIGSDAAIEAADVVLMNDKLTDIAIAKAIANKTMKIVRQNIIVALTVKIAVLLLTITGLVDNLIVAILADVGVSVLAIINAMRALSTPKNTKKFFAKSHLQ